MTIADVGVSQQLGCVPLRGMRVCMETHVGFEIQDAHAGGSCEEYDSLGYQAPIE